MAAPVSAAMPAAPAGRDWTASFARRARALGGGEITAILALAGASDVITFSGGFPDPETFPAGVLAQISARLVAGDPAVALQYSATDGLASLRPKVVSTFPDHQNPTGLSLAAGRRPALAELARRYGFLILEDVAYRELGFDGTRPPSLWALAPDMVVQAGTFSKIFFPGV